MITETARLLTRHARQRSLRFEPLEPRWVLDIGLMITEFMASNDTTLLDGDGNYSDWIEIHNPTLQTIDLTDWYLTDDDGDLNKWMFPSAPTVPQDVLELAPDEYLIVFASGQAADDYVDAAGHLHTNFQLNTEGEYLALVQPDGMTIEHAYEPMYPVQLADTSYGIVRVVDPKDYQTYNWDDWSRLRPALSGSRPGTTDVTGGMSGKVRAMLDLVERLPELQIRVLSGLREGAVASALADRDGAGGTLIVAMP